MLSILFALFLFFIAFKLMRVFPLTPRYASSTGPLPVIIVVLGLITCILGGLKCLVIFIIANAIFFAFRSRRF